MRTADWAVVVPLKRLIAAKSRLRGAVAGLPHDRLVLALAADTVRAVAACRRVGEVLVVTDDPAASRALLALALPPGRVRAVPDKPAAGLNPAIRYAAGLVEPDRPVAALTADLPALRPAELSAALAAATAAGRCGYLPDVAGTGTTLLAAPPGTTLAPRFGPDSASRHAAAGAIRLTGDWPSLRRDVDTADDLAAAARLGLGPHTAALFHPGRPVRGGRDCYRAGMQGTVAQFDPQTHTGSLLLDDGRRVEFDAAAFAASGLRLLRLGQRVQLDYDPHGQLTRIVLPTMRDQ